MFHWLSIRQFASLAALLALAFAAWSPALGQPPKGLTETDLVKRIRLPLDDDVIVGEVKKKGVAFEPDAAALER